MGVTGGNIVNHGYIEVYGNFFATGASATLSFVNTGDIYVTAYGFAYGYTASSGSFDNSGLIDVAGGVNGVGVVLSNTATFNNSGVIRAISYSGNASIGVLLDWVYRPYGPYVNSGLIEADYAFKLAVNPDGGPEAESVEVIFNTGQIHGAIDLAFGDDIIHNDGEISGQTFLADGNDLYDGLLGTHLGQIIGGVGNDTLLGGAGAETFYGELDSDTILGGGGNDVIDGGPGADLLDGGGGFDTLSYLSSDIRVVVDLVAETAYAAGVDRVRGFERVVGSRFGDTLSGTAGAETFEGNAGDDTISAGAGGDTLTGGLGADTLTGGAGNDLFVFSIGDGPDVVTDFQAGGSDDQLRIYGFTAYQSLTQQGADTLVRLSATDSILLRNVLASALTNADFQFSATALAAAPTASGLHNTVLVASDFQVFAGEVVTFGGVAFGIDSNSGRKTSNANGGVSAGVRAP